MELIDPQPTQIRHNWRARIRTFVQLAPMIAAGTATFVEVVREVNPGWVVVWGPIALAASTIITHLMTNEKFNTMLTAIGLGAAPKVKS